MARDERPYRAGLASGLVNTTAQIGGASRSGHAGTGPSLTLLDAGRAEHENRVILRHPVAAPRHDAG